MSFMRLTSLREGGEAEGWTCIAGRRMPLARLAIALQEAPSDERGARRGRLGRVGAEQLEPRLRQAARSKSARNETQNSVDNQQWA